MMKLKANKVQAGRNSSWQSIKAIALEKFRAHKFPSKCEEAWKYTNLNELTDEQIQPTYISDATIVSPIQISPSHYTLVVVNGRVDIAKSRLPECVRVVALNVVDADKQARSFIDKLLIDNPENQPGHVALNTAYAADGIFINLTKGSRLDSPIEIQYITTSKASNSSYTQVWCVMEANSKATLIERFIGDSQAKAKSCHNHVARVLLNDGAELSHYRMQDAPLNCHHIYTAQVQLKCDSRYSSFSAYTGAALSRQEVHVHLQGERVHCDQRGITIGRSNQHHDAYWPVVHAKPNSYSNQHFRQLLDENSKGIFYGMVHVPEGSYKTKAHQLNRNLVLSSEAQAISRPELKIFNHDVICSHGSTTGNLDQEAMYYLQTRGIAANEAKMLLTQAFISEILAQIEFEDIRSAITRQAERALQREAKHNV